MGQDDPFLADLAKNHPRLEGRERAIQRMTDPRVLASLAESHPDPNTRRAASVRLASLSQDGSPNPPASAPDGRSSPPVHPQVRQPSPAAARPPSPPVVPQQRRQHLGPPVASPTRQYGSAPAAPPPTQPIVIPPVVAAPPTQPYVAPPPTRPYISPPSLPQPAPPGPLGPQAQAQVPVRIQAQAPAQVPAAAPSLPAAQAALAVDKKICPSCGKAIYRVAVKCGLCGHVFDSRAARDGAPGQAARAIESGDDSTLEAEVESLKATQSWIAVAQTTSGERHVCTSEQLVPLLRAGILDGTFAKDSTVDVHAKDQEGKWSKSSAPLAQFAQRHFALHVLYAPVWSHALGGLKWGALIGIGLKLLDTLILLGSAEPSLAFMFLLAIGLCLVPRFGIGVVVVASFIMARYSKVNLFMAGVVAALTGALLGCLPGMFVGGIVGFARRGGLPRAPDAAPEPATLFLTGVILPFLGGAILWALYLFVVNPWIASLAK